VAAVAGLLSLVFAVILFGLALKVLVNLDDASYLSFSYFPAFYASVVILAILGFIQFFISISILPACYKDYSENARVSAQPT